MKSKVNRGIAKIEDRPGNRGAQAIHYPSSSTENTKADESFRMAQVNGRRSEDLDSPGAGPSKPKPSSPTTSTVAQDEEEAEELERQHCASFAFSSVLTVVVLKCQDEYLELQRSVQVRFPCCCAALIVEGKHRAALWLVDVSLDLST